MFSELLNLPSGKELKLIDIRCLWTSYLYYSNLCTLIVPRMELEKNISISKWQKSIKVANQFKTLEIPHFSHLILQLYLECLGGRELGGGIYCNKITNVAQVGKVDGCRVRAKHTHCTKAGSGHNLLWTRLALMSDLFADRMEDIDQAIFEVIAKQTNQRHQKQIKMQKGSSLRNDEEMLKQISVQVKR